MIAQIINKDVLKILTVFSLSPGSRFLRKELKDRTRLNNVNLDNALMILLNSNLIKKDKRLLYLNFDKKGAKIIIDLISEEYKSLKELPLDVYFSILDILFFLVKLKNLDVYLFGSYAKLIFKENSDIDIAIISDNINETDRKELNKLIQKTESRYGKSIETHYFGKDFYKNRKDPLMAEILRNGVRLILK